MIAQLERISDRVWSCTEAAVDLDWLREPLHKSDIPAGVYPPFWYRVWLQVKSSFEFARIASGDGL